MSNRYFIFGTDQVHIYSEATTPVFLNVYNQQKHEAPQGREDSQAKLSDGLRYIFQLFHLCLEKPDVLEPEPDPGSPLLDAGYHNVLGYG